MIRFSGHAVERYQARVRPAFTARQCRQELDQLARQIGQVVTGGVDWAATAHRGVVLMLGDDICMPLEPVPGGMVAVTCLARGGLAPGERERRNRRRSARTHARKARSAQRRPRPDLDWA